MLPDRVSNPGPPTYESGALPIALRGPASVKGILSLLVAIKSSGLIFFAEKTLKSFAVKKLLPFFWSKIGLFLHTVPLKIKQLVN